MPDFNLFEFITSANIDYRLGIIIKLSNTGIINRKEKKNESTKNCIRQKLRYRLYVIVLHICI